MNNWIGYFTALLVMMLVLAGCEISASLKQLAQNQLITCPDRGGF